MGRGVGKGLESGGGRREESEEERPSRNKWRELALNSVCSQDDL